MDSCGNWKGQFEFSRNKMLITFYAYFHSNSPSTIIRTALNCFHCVKHYIPYTNMLTLKLFYSAPASEYGAEYRALFLCGDPSFSR